MTASRIESLIAELLARRIAEDIHALILGCRLRSVDESMIVEGAGRVIKDVVEIQGKP